VSGDRGQLPALVDTVSAITTSASTQRNSLAVLAMVANAGNRAAKRFLEFFAAGIENDNTRMAYYRAVCNFFDWLEQHGIGELPDIEPFHVAAYLKALRVSDAANRAIKNRTASRPTALIGVMVYSFARISAVVAMEVEDYFSNGKRWWLRLHEKGGKRHEMPAHHKLEQFLDEYLDVAGIRDGGKTPLFRSAAGRTGILTDRPMHRVDAYQMVRRRTAEAGLKGKLGCHVFRATGITAYLEAGGTLENAQAMAAHESPRATKLYDRTGDEITLDEVERIQI
jgi:integrase